MGTHLNCIQVDAIQMGTHNIYFCKENQNVMKTPIQIYKKIHLQKLKIFR